MRGQMMELPLTITSILRHAKANHPQREIVSAIAEGQTHRYTYAEAFGRAARLANALKRLGVRQGERVGTLAWNDYRHFEIYFGVSCYGAVLHTVNPRLFPEQVAYIINHAADRFLLADPLFVPLLEAMQGQLRAVEGYVVLCDEAQMPRTELKNALSYEVLLAAESDEFHWPDLDEKAASSMCYTSGTTGNPKGVVYSHRSTVLHSYGTALPDVLDLRARDTVLPLVPLFHVNAWGTPYSVPMVGARMVLPGRFAGDPATVQGLVEAEGVTVSLGVPTVWLALLSQLEQSGGTLGRLERVIVGGAACPASIVAGLKRFGVEARQGWGMTEMSPLGTLNAPKDDVPGRDLSQPPKQGRAIFGVEMKIVNDEGKALPWDGQSSGRLMVRGPWVCDSYYLPDEGVHSHDVDGWFETGDVATIDGEGFMQITDRTKDLIKSGGEWISSIELEHLAMSHPQVAEAAVIGIPDPKWSERPLLVVVLKPGMPPDRDSLLACYHGKVAKFCIPDDVVFVAELPHTATGKISKVRLREQFASRSAAPPG